MGANGASGQELQIAHKNRFHTNFSKKIIDLSLPIYTLETFRFCMKCIEFTTRTYNFKNLAVGSLIWRAKTGVNSSYFPQKFSTCPVLCCIFLGGNACHLPVSDSVTYRKVTLMMGFFGQ